MDSIKKLCEKCFKAWKSDFEALSESKVTPRDFDCWMSGWMAGYSAMKECTQEEIQEVVEHMLTTKAVKACGVTGTKIESFGTIELNKK